MFGRDLLDHHLVHEAPHPLWMGEMPYSYGDIPSKFAVNACGMNPAPAAGVIVLALPMHDAEEPELMPSRDDVERFLDAAHVYAGKEASYWHCQAGLNRSGLLVAAYLHRHRGVPIGDAIETLRSRRSDSVLCNALFEAKLREWYGNREEQAVKPRFSFDAWKLLRMGRRA